MILGFLLAANPWLLAGTALIGVPIIIHILNKRRFKIVHWAAMDLLLSVDQRNRKRLQMEDLLILFLRCLAVLLLAFLVARLIFDPSGIGLSDAAGARMERIVVLDDSPSLAQRTGNRTVFKTATEQLAQSVRDLARDRSGDTLTLVLTSRPQQPLFNGQLLTEENVEQVARTIEGLTVAGSTASFEQVFLGADDWLPVDPTATENRILYVISDFREPDWQAAGSEDGGVLATLRDLAPRVQRVILSDVGRDVDDDLAIVDLRPSEENLVSDVPTRFSVTVANRGTTDVEDATVELSMGQGGGVTRDLGLIPAGETRTFRVPVQFHGPGSVQVTATLSGDDAWAFDDQRHFAGVAESGIPVAVVDGEPDIDPVGSESFFLRRALVPPGDRASGLRVDVIDEQELATFDPSAYRVVFLCNVFRLPSEMIGQLDAWVKAGGVLVIAPGDLVDAGFWSDELAQVAPDLAVVRFADTVGRASEEEWVTLQVTRPDHPVLEIFAGEQNPFLKRLKFYQHWRLESMSENADILATFSDGDPALLQAPVGLGQVLVLAMPVDAEWSTWPSNPSYVVIMQQLVQQLVRSRQDTRNLQVGQALWFPLDTAVYRSSGILTAPDSLDGDPLAAQSGEDGQVGLAWPALSRVGIWQLHLETHEDQTTTIALGVNAQADESIATRANHDDLTRRLADTQVAILDSVVLNAADDGGGRIDLARACAYLALLALLVEQLLAWRFTRRRMS